MRALVLYSASGKLDQLAKSLAKGLEEAGYQVQLMEAVANSSSPIPMAQYDLVCIGSTTEGLFGGEIAADISAALKRSTRLQGKPTAAFVRSKLFGSGRSLKALMESLESQGAWVQDFAAISTPEDALKMGRRLDKVQRL